jgi:hypothetical protein
MRVASRIVGVVFALTGLGFLAIPGYLVVLRGLRSNGADWIIVAVLIAAGACCLLAGRYFLKLDVDAPDETQEQAASRFAPYFIAHRRELRLIAQLGLVISLIRLGAACFGAEWPARWAAWPLVLAFIGLGIVAEQIAQAADRLDWERVPDPMRPALRIMWKAVGPALWVLLLLLAWSQWQRQVSWLAVTSGILVVVVFAWEALFFAYGGMRGDD